MTTLIKARGINHYDGIGSQLDSIQTGESIVVDDPNPGATRFSLRLQRWLLRNRHYSVTTRTCTDGRYQLTKIAGGKKMSGKDILMAVGRMAAAYEHYSGERLPETFTGNLVRRPDLYLGELARKSMLVGNDDLIKAQADASELIAVDEMTAATFATPEHESQYWIGYYQEIKRLG